MMCTPFRRLTVMICLTLLYAGSVYGQGSEATVTETGEKPPPVAANPSDPKPPDQEGGPYPFSPYPYFLFIEEDALAGEIRPESFLFTPPKEVVADELWIESNIGKPRPYILPDEEIPDPSRFQADPAQNDAADVTIEQERDTSQLLHPDGLYLEGE